MMRVLLAFQRMERHNTCIRCPRPASPGDPFIGYLFGYFGVGGLFFAANDGAPMQVLIVQLLNCHDAFFRKLREIFKLCPLVIRRMHRHIHVY
jgi:hypothetical protein